MANNFFVVVNYKNTCRNTSYKYYFLCFLQVGEIIIFWKTIIGYCRFVIYRTTLTSKSPPHIKLCVISKCNFVSVSDFTEMDVYLANGKVGCYKSYTK